MAKNLVVIISLASLILISSSAMALTPKILEPEIKIKDNNIIVNTGLIHTSDLETIINSGIEKEIVFTIELFRVWKLWPDEFVMSKKIRRIIKYDNLRGQYLTSSYDGVSLQTKKKFADFNAIMKNWFFTVDKINLANIKELETGNYYIRVVVESKSREVPPVIGFLMLFIPEVEMSLARESRVFNILSMTHRGAIR
jgi:hypothetical protein